MREEIPDLTVGVRGGVRQRVSDGEAEAEALLHFVGAFSELLCGEGYFMLQSEKLRREASVKGGGGVKGSSGPPEEQC